jgi:hypothetical protein
MHGERMVANLMTENRFGGSFKMGSFARREISG